MQSNGHWPSFSVQGVRVDAVQIPDVIAQMKAWILERRSEHFIAVTSMHGVSEANRDEGFRAVLRDADLVVPDGMPLVWIGSLKGHPLRRRVYGPELMLCFCEETAAEGYRHFFYGGAPGVPERLAEVLARRFPGLQVAGMYSPPFRERIAPESAEICEMIRSARPDVLWVGLSTPKQERWMHAHRGLLDVPLMVGVGAAFDLNCGRVRQAPVWMREHGFEWMWRLGQEPRRLWRRYLFQGPHFAWNAALELARLKQFD